jgi:hypothetical protein
MARELFIMLAQEKGSQGRRLRAGGVLTHTVKTVPSAPGCRADQVWSLPLVDNHHSLILFTNDDRVGSIISGLPEHIAVRQLASQPEGIVQDEANVAFLFQKVE